MLDKHPDCDLATTLRHISFFFSREQHANDMRDNSFYRRNVELLQEKKYLFIENDLVVITQAGNELLEKCR